MSEQGDAGASQPFGARRRSWKRSRRLWCLLGALCCLLAAMAFAFVIRPPRPVIYDSSNYLHGQNAPVSVCATQHYRLDTSGHWSGGTCSQNDVVLSRSDASRAWVTFQEIDWAGTLRDDFVPVTFYLRQHDGHWRLFSYEPYYTCAGAFSRYWCDLPLRSIFQRVGLTLRAGTTYDVGAYVNADCSECSHLPAQPALPLSFTITR
jgi:hypothetical protein